MTNAISQIQIPKNEPVCPYKKNMEETKHLKEELIRQKAKTITIPLVINGEKITDRPTKKLTSPHETSRVLAHVCEATKKDVHEAIESSLKARKEWSMLPWEERLSVFLKAADLLSTTYRDKINAATMLGQSKTCYQSEIDAICELADFFRFNAYFAQEIYKEQPLHSSMGQWNRVEARGLEGFVFAVSPFNFTSIAVNLAASPAMMGCSVIWKPAPTAMLACHYALELLEKAGLPKGVINLISGDPQMIGQEILSNPNLSGIHFTGSTKIFDYLSMEVGKNLNSYKQYPRIVGETGGKGFVVAHESACEKELTAALIRGAFEFQGQKCSAASRAFIPKSLWKKMKAHLIAETKSISMGDPCDFKNFMSAVIDENAYKKITGYINDAKHSKDASILTGGTYDDSVGYFIEPTIIEATNPHYKTMVEEIFGPVLTVYVYEDKDFEKVLALVDESTPYALTGAIFAKDRQVIHNMTKHLIHAAGNLYINDKPTGAVVGQQPFGGSRRSGTNDKAGSPFNLLRWTSHRTIKENFLEITDYRYPFMD